MQNRRRRIELMYSGMTLLPRRVLAVLPCLCVTVCLVAACEMPTEWSSYGEPRTVALRHVFAIDEGTSVRLGKSSARLDFEGVIQDSRCPDDALCIVAGAASAAFRLHGKAADTTFTLTIPGLVSVPHERNARVDVGSLAFKLLELTPYPGTIPESAGGPSYRALLTADER